MSIDDEATMADPEIVSPEEWRAARIALLDKEKALSKARDEVSAERRRLPMVEITADYAFEGPEGKVQLLDLFEGRSQLLIYHFMWLWDEGVGCPSCSFIVDNIGHLSHLHARDTSLAVVTRAPWVDAEGYRRRMGWTMPWYSSYGSAFNYDFHVSIDPAVAPVEYNYRSLPELEAENEAWTGWAGDQPGTSAFLRHGDRVFRTWSGYGRAGDLLIGTYNYLDLTARGRQEDWEQPPGRSDGPAMAWLDYHDRYGADGAGAADEPG
jgi:predicted dithiol-disulfide oxidoreductase (DUF899 family)